jgi:hypothetical protein
VQEHGELVPAQASGGVSCPDTVQPRAHGCR